MRNKVEFWTYKGYLFDFDKTLYSLRTDWSAYKSNVYDFAEKFDIKKMDTEYFAQFAKRVISKSDKLYNVLQKLELVNDIENCSINESYEKIVKLIIELPARAAIVSNNFMSTITHILKKNDMVKYFDPILALDNSNFIKPDSSEIEKIIKNWSLSNSEVLFIGDRKSDQIAASNANISFMHADRLQSVLNHFPENV